MPYCLPIRAKESVRWSHAAATQNRSPKSGIWKTAGCSSMLPNPNPNPYSTSWLVQATKRWPAGM